MTTAQDWILYQIGSAEPNRYRFVITRGFQDEVVERHLRDGEFIDAVTTLLGELGGDVTVLADAVLVPGVKRIHADELLAYVKEVREHMGNTGFFFDFFANGSVALWYQEYAKKLEGLLPKEAVQLETGWPETDHIYARAAARIAALLAVLAEADEYLSGGEQNYIGNMSVLHQKMRAAINKALGKS